MNENALAVFLKPKIFIIPAILCESLINMYIIKPIIIVDTKIMIINITISIKPAVQEPFSNKLIRASTDIILSIFET